MTIQESCHRCRTIALPGVAACLRCGESLGPDRVRPETDETDETGQPPEPAAEPAPARAAPATEGLWVDPEKGPKRLLWIVTAFASVAALLLGQFLVKATLFSPETVVRQYFSALGKRDAEAVLHTLPPDDAEQLRGSPLLSPEALRNPGYEPPSDLEILDVTEEDVTEESGEREDRTASVKVRYVVGTARYTSFLRLIRDDDSTLALFHRWRVADLGVPLSVTAPGSTEVMVDGQTVRAQPEQEGIQTVALVGRHTVRLADNPMLEATPTKVAVTYAAAADGDAGASVDLPVSIRPSANAEVDRQVRQLVDQCARSHDIAPKGCPFADPFHFGEVSDVRWKVTAYPQVTLERAEYGDAPVVTTVTRGTATVSGTEEGYLGKEPYSQSVEISVEGTVRLVDGRIQLVLPGGPE
ncbi:hypothetical protein [Actinomadura geliboluensis]|uniref:hypothetical protein n=1 Tax=Actinomadura geliboluensis TaxID=882440 RepID=UPI00371FD92B